MGTRKTREQLDAEMGQLPPPGGEAQPPAEPGAAAPGDAEGELPDEYEGSAAVGEEASPEGGQPPASELEFVEEGPAVGPARDDGPSGEDVLRDPAATPRPEPPAEGAPLLPPPEDPAAAEGEEVEPRLAARLKGVVESLLFVAGEPLPVSSLLPLVRDIQPGLSARALRGLLDTLREELREGARGVRLAEVAGGYQLRTPSEFSQQVRKLITRRPPRMTRPTLETLAIIAYRQPITRAEVEDIRGVDSGPVLKHLLEKKLVRILGRKEDVGRPLIYGTTKEFLEFFALKDLKSLPTLKDFVELSDEHRAQLGLEAREAGGEQAEAEAEPSLVPVATDEYAPVGEDEVLKELSEALDALKSRNRVLKKDVFGKSDGSDKSDETEGSDKSDSEPSEEELAELDAAVAEGGAGDAGDGDDEDEDPKEEL